MKKIVIVLILMGLISATYGMVMLNDVEITSKNVDCYDRFKNKIDGLVCEKEIYSNQTEIFTSALLSAMLFAIAIVLQAREVGL